MWQAPGRNHVRANAQFITAPVFSWRQRSKRALAARHERGAVEVNGELACGAVKTGVGDKAGRASERQSRQQPHDRQDHQHFGEGEGGR